MSGRKLKLTAVGDRVEGRRDLLHLPSKVEGKQVTVDGKAVMVSLRDTGAMEELDRLQPAVYRDTDCFLLCYAESVKSSLDSVESKWCQEIKTLCPDKPFVVLGYNTDGVSAVVTQSDASKVATKIGAATHLLYSSPADLEAVLAGAAKAAMNHAPPKEAVQSSSAGLVDEEGGGGRGCCSCFTRCFQKKDSSYNLAG